ncbi:MAG TPA: hypothetical protein ENL04_03475, partial [Sulfuricurvum sp.]|nr:hypothetical protein [Sulfuricurvum sp.]
METKKKLSKLEDAADIKKVVAIFGKNKALSLFIISLFFVGGFFYAYFTPPVYETYATIEVSNDNLDLSLDNVVRGGNVNNEATLIDTEVEILKSRSLIEKALEDVGFQVRYFTFNNYKEIELYKSSPIKISELKVKNPLVYGTKFVVEPINDQKFKLYVDNGGILTSVRKSLASLLGKTSRELQFSGEFAFNEKIDNSYFTMVVQ